MGKEQRASAPATMTNEQADWFFFDWWQRDPYTACAAAVRHEKQGKNPGTALRLLEAMARVHLQTKGVFSDEFQVPKRPDGPQRNQVQQPTGGRAVRGTSTARAQRGGA